MLDATRAAANLLPTPPDKVVIVGHSQGGHAALAAQSYAKAYGMKRHAGRRRGVRAALRRRCRCGRPRRRRPRASRPPTTGSPSCTRWSTRIRPARCAEIRGGGLAVFQSAKQQAAKDAMLGAIASPWPSCMALGADARRLLRHGLRQQRRVHLRGQPVRVRLHDGAVDAAGRRALVAVALASGSPGARSDLGVPDPHLVRRHGHVRKPGFAECAREKFGKDLMATGATTTIQYCFDADAQHRDLIRRAPFDYVNQWIAARAGVGTEPTACTEFPATTTCDPADTTSNRRPHDLAAAYRRRRRDRRRSTARAVRAAPRRCRGTARPRAGARR